jgi:hypothetical protein
MRQLVYTVTPSADDGGQRCQNQKGARIHKGSARPSCVWTAELTSGLHGDTQVDGRADVFGCLRDRSLWRSAETVAAGRN